MSPWLPLAARTDLGGWRWTSLPAGWVLVLVAVGLFLFFRVLYRGERGRAGAGKRLGLALLRALILFLVILALSAPYREEVRIAEERSHLVVLVDASGSMQTQDRYSPDVETRLRAAAWPEGEASPPAPLKVSRLELLKRVLAPKDARLLEELDRRFVLHVYGFASDWWSLGSSREERPSDATAPEADGKDPIPSIAEAIRGLDPDVVGQGGTNLGTVLRNVAGEYLGREDRRLAGVLLLSDGRDTSNDETPLEVVASFGAARTDLHVTPIGMGNDASGRNVYLEKIRALDVVLVDDEVVFESAIRHRGFGGQPGVGAHLEIVQIADADGRPMPDTPFEVEGDGAKAGPFTLPVGDEPVGLRLQARMNRPGTFLVRVKLDLPPDAQGLDSIQDDNVQVHRLRVVDERIKVLLVDNSPRLDFRFLGNYLTREPGDTYVEGRRRYEAQLLQLSADPAVEQGHSPGVEPLRRMPATRRELFAYDVIILGDVDWRSLADTSQEAQDILETLRNFVREGGGLAFIAGIDYQDPLSYVDTPLEDLLPITPRKTDMNASDEKDIAFGLELTDVGRLHPMFGVVPGRDGGIATPEEVAEIWRGESSYSKDWFWYWMYRATRGLKPGAFALARARPLDPTQRRRFEDENGQPYVVFAAMPYGKGRVFFSALDNIHRLRYGLGDAIYGPFWDQIIRYLATYRLLGGNKRFKISTDRETYYVGDLATVTITALDRNFEPMRDPWLEGVHLMYPDGRDVVLEDDMKPYNATSEGAAPGTYRTTIPIRRSGTWRIWISDPTATGEERAEHRFEAVDETPERQLTDPNHALLAEIARQTDGRLFDGRVARIDELAEIARELPARTDRRVIDRAERPQWDKPWVLLLIVGLLALEWILRKRSQMI